MHCALWPLGLGCGLKSSLASQAEPAEDRRDSLGFYTVIQAVG